MAATNRYTPPTELFQILLDPTTSTSSLSPEFEAQFKRMQHISYTLGQDNHDDQLYFHVTDYLKMSALYWALMALYLTGGIHHANKTQLIAFIEKCYDPESGGYRGNIDHSVHLLYTLSAVQILAILGRLDLVDKPRIITYISSLQRKDGSFVGDVWGEVDTRFSYCAILTLAIINALPTVPQILNQQQHQSQQITCPLISQSLSTINFHTAVEYVLSCRNFDGGFGAVSGGESHSGQIFCSLAFLCLLGVVPYTLPTPKCLTPSQLIGQGDTTQQQEQQTSNAPSDATETAPGTTTEGPPVDEQENVLGWWLCERQLANGGLNGRPEKKEDVCYSWWVLTCLTMLKKVHWINKEKLTAFVLSCQDSIYGGISDRSNTMTDIYHTYFGIAGLSLLNNPGLELIEPVYALPVSIVIKLRR